MGSYKWGSKSPQKIMVTLLIAPLATTHVPLGRLQLWAHYTIIITMNPGNCLGPYIRLLEPSQTRKPAT